MLISPLISSISIIAETRGSHKPKISVCGAAVIELCKAAFGGLAVFCADVQAGLLHRAHDHVEADVARAAQQAGQVEGVHGALGSHGVALDTRDLDKAQKAAKGGDKRFLREAEVFSALLEHLNEGKLARTFECSDDDRALIATSDLLTLKRTIYAANVSEDAVNDPESVPYFQQVKKLADEEGSLALPICAKLEADIAELDDPDEKAMFMEELGLKQSGLDRLIQASYELLGLISFLTAGSDECRAWTIKKGTRAPQAAGKIHSDFERGFIRAEVIAFDDLKACGTMAAAKAKGLVRSEGKEYVMKDGDIVNFLFNV